ncbi:hypothetical protein TrVGV298_008566 [Trichoderma virens]|nr:hypothetical protein TrVGV298_008566 [Trichoderma virens]
MSNLSCPKVIADVGWVWFTKPSMRTTNLDIRVSIGPEVDIGWVSSITASIFYGNALIGEATQEDTFLESPDQAIESLLLN